MTMSLFYLFLGPLSRVMIEVAQSEIAGIAETGGAAEVAIPLSGVSATAA